MNQGSRQHKQDKTREEKRVMKCRARSVWCTDSLHGMLLVFNLLILEVKGREYVIGDACTLVLG